MATTLRAIDATISVSKHSTRNERKGSATKDLSVGRKINAEEADLYDITNKSGSKSVLDSLQTHKSKLNSLAGRIRAFDRTLESVETSIDKMKARLMTIVKSYPPFPPGSEERIRVLRSYRALWKQISQIAPVPEFEKIISLPSFSQDGRSSPKDATNSSPEATSSDGIHPIAEHLQIPDLPETDSDEQVHAVMERIELAKEEITEWRDFVRNSGSNLRFSPLSTGDAQRAEQESEEMRTALAVKQIPGLARDHSELLSLLV